MDDKRNRHFRRSLGSLFAITGLAWGILCLPSRATSVAVEPESLVNAPQRFWARSIVFKDRLTRHATGRSQRIDDRRYTPFSTRVVGTCYATAELVPVLNSLDLNRDYAFTGTVLQHRRSYFIIISEINAVVDPADMIREMRELAPDLDPAITEEALKPIAEIVWEVESAHFAYSREKDVPLCDLYDPQSIHFPRIMEIVRSSILNKEMEERTVSSELLAQYLVLALARSCGVTGAIGRVAAPAPEPVPDKPVASGSVASGPPPVREEEIPSAEELPDQLQRAGEERLALEAAEARRAQELLEAERLAAEQERIRLEAERERIAAERAELERFAAEAEEARRQQEELEAERIAAEQERIRLETERERIAAERAELERLTLEAEEAAKRAQEAREAEQRGILERRERERITAARAEQERVAREAEVAQQQAVEAQQREQERLKAEEAEKAMAEAARRKAAEDRRAAQRAAEEAGRRRIEEKQQIVPPEAEPEAVPVPVIQEPADEPQEETSWWQRFQERRRLAREEAQRRQAAWDEYFRQEEARVRAERQARREEKERKARERVQAKEQEEREAQTRAEQLEREPLAATPPPSAPAEPVEATPAPTPNETVETDPTEDEPSILDTIDPAELQRLTRQEERKYQEFEEQMRRATERMERQRKAAERDIERRMRRFGP